MSGETYGSILAVLEEPDSALPILVLSWRSEVDGSCLCWLRSQFMQRVSQSTVCSGRPRFHKGAVGVSTALCTVLAKMGLAMPSSVLSSEGAATSSDWAGVAPSPSRMPSAAIVASKASARRKEVPGEAATSAAGAGKFSMAAHDSGVFGVESKRLVGILLERAALPGNGVAKAATAHANGRCPQGHKVVVQDDLPRCPFGASALKGCFAKGPDNHVHDANKSTTCKAESSFLAVYACRFAEGPHHESRLHDSVFDGAEDLDSGKHSLHTEGTLFEGEFAECHCCRSASIHPGPYVWQSCSPSCPYQGHHLLSSMYIGSDEPDLHIPHSLLPEDPAVHMQSFHHS